MTTAAAAAASLDAEEPVEIGHTTRLGDRQITGPAYVPSPDRFLALLAAGVFEKEVRAQGIDPLAVQHVVLRRPEARSGGPLVGAYVTTDIAKEDPDDITYVRVA